ncbi:MAG: hypothetical protein ACREM1_00360 [Longimicrobiales bacterium]
MRRSRLITAGVLALAVCGDPSSPPQPEEEEEEEDPSPGVAAVADLEPKSVHG